MCEDNYISTFKSIIDHEISLDPSERDYDLLEKKLDEYLRVTVVDVEELEIAAERHKIKLLDRIRKHHSEPHGL